VAIKENISFSTPGISSHIVRQAIAWRIKLESGENDSNSLLACQQWREISPEHEIVWCRLDDMQSTFDQAAQQSPKLAKPVLLKTAHERHHVNRRQALRTITGSALGLATLGFLGQQQGVVELVRADYSAFREPSEYTLTDTSRVWLNAHSNIKVEFTQAVLKIELLRGEMQFTSAPEHQPIEVNTSQGILTLSDSTFWVRQAKQFSLLQVNSGSVMVKSHHTGQTITAQQGGLYRLDSHSIQPLDSRLFDYSSWVGGVFYVSNMPLKSFLKELSHYSFGSLNCDSILDSALISGVYQLNNIDLIMETVALSLQSKIRHIGPWWAQIKPKSIIN
jgi:transmembrane sensor